jgi:hypothetical protein
MAFTHYSPVTVNGGQVPAAQSDFPMLINSTDTRFKTTGNGGHVQNSNGYDVRPYSDSALTSPLTYELERYNGSTGEVVMWVKIASIDVGSVVYLAYGDSSLSTDGSSTNTWSNSFTAVWHLKDGSTLSVNDSTAGAYNGNNHGVTAAAGQIDGCGGFASASSQYIDTDGVTPPMTAAFTYSLWLNGTTFPNDYNGTITRGQAAVDDTAIFVKSNGLLYVKTSQVNYDGTGSITLSTATWYYVVAAYDSTNGLNVWINGSLDKNVAASGNQTTGAIATDIGRQRSTGTRYFNGKMDEVRIASAARSANWMTTEYNNQNAPGTFYTLGSEVAQAAKAVILAWH